MSAKVFCPLPIYALCLPKPIKLDSLRFISQRLQLFIVNDQELLSFTADPILLRFETQLVHVRVDVGVENTMLKLSRALCLDIFLDPLHLKF